MEFSFNHTLTIGYDKINYIFVRPKADGTQLNLPHGTKKTHQPPAHDTLDPQLHVDKGCYTIPSASSLFSGYSAANNVGKGRND